VAATALATGRHPHRLTGSALGVAIPLGLTCPDGDVAGLDENLLKLTREMGSA